MNQDKREAGAREADAEKSAARFRAEAKKPPTGRVVMLVKADGQGCPCPFDSRDADRLIASGRWKKDESGATVPPQMTQVGPPPEEPPSAPARPAVSSSASSSAARRLDPEEELG